MKFRLNFDDQICAALIEKIVDRGRGGSLNKTLQTMIIEWSALEDAGKQPESSQKAVKKQPSGSFLDEQIDQVLGNMNNDF